MPKEKKSILKQKKLTIGERLKSIRDAHNYSANKFAEILGISQSSFTKLENDQAEPRTRTLLALHEKFGVDPLWLLTGQASRVIQSQTALSIGKLADNLPDEIQKILLTLIQREVRLERILKRETDNINSDLPDDLDQ